MEKQRTVNTVTNNDGFSSGLMEAYGRWMGGDTFQNSTIKEEEGIPTGQKQGGEGSGSFTSVGGELPAVEFDKSSGLPTIPELGVSDDTSKKDPKGTSNGGEPPTNKNGLKPKYGAQIKNTVLVGANEEAEKCDNCGGAIHEGSCKGKKMKKEENNIMDTQEWKDAAKKQTDRIMDIWKKA